MTFLLASTIGAKALYLLLAWLAGAAGAAHVSERKGYGDRLGLATGLVLSLLAIPIWLAVPAREGSEWAARGARQRGISSE
jgi:hypothetical protein